MGMEKNSSVDTRTRALNLATQIGSYHLNINIDSAVEAILSVFEAATKKRPVYEVRFHHVLLRKSQRRGW